MSLTPDSALMLNLTRQENIIAELQAQLERLTAENAMLRDSFAELTAPKPRARRKA